MSRITEYITKEEACKESFIVQTKEYGSIEVVPVDYIASIKSADVQPVDRWISCKDEMPEEYKTVLVYEKDYGVMIGEFDNQCFIARKSGLLIRTSNVTRWQPLPEPPKDGDMK